MAAAAAGAGGGVAIGQLVPISQVRQYADDSSFCWETRNGFYLGSFRTYTRSGGVEGDRIHDIIHVYPATYTFDYGNISSESLSEVTATNQARYHLHHIAILPELHVRRVECRVAPRVSPSVEIGQLVPISHVRQYIDNSDVCWEDSNGKYLGYFLVYLRSKGVTEPSPGYFEIKPATYVFLNGKIESSAASEIVQSIRDRISNISSYIYDNEPKVRRVACGRHRFSELRKRGVTDKRAREILGLHMTAPQRRSYLLKMLEHQGENTPLEAHDETPDATVPPPDTVPPPATVPPPDTVPPPATVPPAKNSRIEFKCDWVKRDDKWLLKCPECGRVERSESSGQIKHKDGCPYQSKIMWKPVPREPKPTNGGRRRTRRSKRSSRKVH
jgi:hypothetical protein